MDLALPELLCREDILKILDQRKLHIHNVNQLTDDELLRIYKRFVMPLAKRPDRSKKIKQSFNLQMLKSENDYMDIDHPNTFCNGMDITYAEDCNIEHLSSSERIASPVGEKRRQPSSDEDILYIFENDFQFQLTSVTKRIRINTLS